MSSPFPGMDPYLEQGPIFQELHTQMLAEAQALLQPQLRPKYVARLERHLSEGSAWDNDLEVSTLEGKEPDITIARVSPRGSRRSSTAVLLAPTAFKSEDLEAAELELRKQRRIVIYLQGRPRRAVATIELLSPSNKSQGSLSQSRYLEKRGSALHGGLHWMEIDLLRGGIRPAVPVVAPASDYSAYVAQATPKGWNHLVYSWSLREPLPTLPIPLLGRDQAALDLSQCFEVAYDRIAADDDVDYQAEPEPAVAADRQWIDGVLREKGIRK